MLRSIVYSAVIAVVMAVGIGSTPASADDWQQGWAGAQFSAGDSGMVRGSARSRVQQRASRDAYADDAGSARPRTTRKAKARDQDEGRPARRRSRTAKAAPGDDQSPRPSRRTARSSGGDQTGIASFYWQPQRLATGGWFNPNAMTAAHRSLPFWTRVRVTHLGNGRSVEVVINDRGPYVGGRIIDLSRAAAGAIGMQGQGLAQVRVEVLGR